MLMMMMVGCDIDKVNGVMGSMNDESFQDSCDEGMMKRGGRLRLNFISQKSVNIY